jgi:protein-disulfide isomerase
MSRYTAEMDDEIYRQRVREHIETGRQSGVRSTPGIFINGAVQDASAGMQPLFDAVEAILRQR